MQHNIHRDIADRLFGVAKSFLRLSRAAYDRVGYRPMRSRAHQPAIYLFKRPAPSPRIVIIRVRYLKPCAEKAEKRPLHRDTDDCRKGRSLAGQSVVPKSGNRFSEKIMLKQKAGP
jgi:hypothetical protein